MGQINLFAPSYAPEPQRLSEALRDFLNTYRDGLLVPIGHVRILEDKTYPHVELNMAKVESSYVLVEIAAPLIEADITWLYRAIIADEKPITKEVARAYSIERTLNPTHIPGKALPNGYRRRVEGDNEWHQVRQFRQHLELPKLALEHYKTTRRSGGKVNVERVGPILVIEYDAIDKPKNPRHVSRQEEVMQAGSWVE